MEWWDSGALHIAKGTDDGIFRHNEENRELVRSELDRQHGIRVYALSLKLPTSLLAAGERRAQKDVAAIFRVATTTFVRRIQQF